MGSAGFSSWSDRAEWPLLIALAIGLLIGLERERRWVDDAMGPPAGLRTFALVGLLGGLVAQFGNITLVATVAALVALAALVAHTLRRREDPDLTGQVALLVTFILGALAQTKGDLAIAAGISTAALLAFRLELHHLARDRLSNQELLDALAVAVAALVVLPLLPRHAIDPFGLFNPFTIWRLAVVAMALGYMGYVGQKLLGERYGLLVMGFAAGLISSTAAVATMGARAKQDPNVVRQSAAGALASTVGSTCYLIILMNAVTPARATLVLVAPLAGAIVPVLGYASWLFFAEKPGSARSSYFPARPFSYRTVAAFVALVATFTACSEILIRWLGQPGLLLGAAIMGVADVHAVSVSITNIAANAQVAPTIAALGVLLAVTTNMLIKIPAAYLTGDKPYGRHLSLGIVLFLVGMWSCEGMTRLYTDG